MSVLDILDFVAWIVVMGMMSLMALGIGLQLNAYAIDGVEDEELIQDIESGKLHKQRAVVYLILMSCTIMALTLFSSKPTIDDFPQLRILYVPCVIFMIFACAKEVREIVKLNPLYFCYVWLTGRLLYGMIEGTI